MSETATTSSTTGPSYARYWKMWGALLILTLLMVFLPSSLPVIIVGIGLKVTIIGAVFMHLKDEALDFVLIICFNILFFSLLLYGLLVPDGVVM